MKKTTVMMLASATMLLAAPTTEPAPQTNTTMGQGKCKTKSICKTKNRCKSKNMKRDRMDSPFLIKRGLPHLTKIVMRNINDKSLALTNDQKEKLTKTQIKTKNSIKEVSQKIIQLRKEIVKASTSGTPAMNLKRSVEKLAVLEAYATMIQLKCIEETKALLTKDQLFYLLTNKNKDRANK